VVAGEHLRETTIGEIEELRAEATTELNRLHEAIGSEVSRIRDVTESTLGDVATTLPAEVEELRQSTQHDLVGLRKLMDEQLDRVRETTGEQLDRVRETTGEQLDRVRWSIPGELERSQGDSAKALDAIGREVAEISRTMHEAIVQMRAFRAALPADGPARGDGEDGAEGRPQVDPAELARRLDHVLVAINRNTDRLADAIHRTTRSPAG
jgi:hypothetical protein